MYIYIKVKEKKGKRKIGIKKENIYYNCLSFNWIVAIKISSINLNSNDYIKLVS